MSCGQACVYNTLRGCMIDEYGGECPMSNMAYKEQKPMTNAQKIRAMTDEELAEWIVISRKYPICDAHCAKRSITTPCNGECDKGVLNWLQQPCGGADHEA